MQGEGPVNASTSRRVWEGLIFQIKCEAAGPEAKAPRKMPWSTPQERLGRGRGRGWEDGEGEAGERERERLGRGRGWGEGEAEVVKTVPCGGGGCARLGKTLRRRGQFKGKVLPMAPNDSHQGSKLGLRVCPCTPCL